MKLEVWMHDGDPYVIDADIAEVDHRGALLLSKADSNITETKMSSLLLVAVFAPGTWSFFVNPDYQVLDESPVVTYPDWQ